MNLATRMAMDPAAITWNSKTNGRSPMAHMGFGAVTAQLAAKGATNPGALAAFIGKKKYGPKGLSALVAAGQVKPGDKSKAGKAKKRRAADILKAANKAAPTSK